MLYFNGNHRKTLFFAHFHMFTSTYIHSINLSLFFVLIHQINRETAGQRNRDDKEKEREHRKNRGHDHYIFYNLKARKDARYTIRKKSTNIVTFMCRLIHLTYDYECDY